MGISIEDRSGAYGLPGPEKRTRTKSTGARDNRRVFILCIEASGALFRPRASDLESHPYRREPALVSAPPASSDVPASRRQCEPQPSPNRNTTGPAPPEARLPVAGAPSTGPPPGVPAMIG